MESSWGKKSFMYDKCNNSNNMITINKIVNTMKNIINSITDIKKRTVKHVLAILLLQINASKEEVEKVIGQSFLDFLIGDIGKKHFSLTFKTDGDIGISILDTNVLNDFTNTKPTSFTQIFNNNSPTENDEIKESFQPMFINQQMRFQYLKIKGKLMLSVVFMLCPLPVISLQTFNNNFLVFNNIPLDAKFRQKYFGAGNLAAIIKRNFENYLELKLIDSESFICSKMTKRDFEVNCEILANKYHEICASTTSSDFDRWIPFGMTFSKLFD